MSLVPVSSVAKEPKMPRGGGLAAAMRSLFAKSAPGTYRGVVGSGRCLGKFLIIAPSCWALVFLFKMTSASRPLVEDFIMLTSWYPDTMQRGHSFEQPPPKGGWGTKSTSMTLPKLRPTRMWAALPWCNRRSRPGTENELRVSDLIE